MIAPTFESWLADLFGQSEFEVERLLRNRCAIHFLIAWSMFEGTCFSGFMRHENIDGFSERIIVDEEFNENCLSEAVEYFHKRYKNNDNYRRLMHRQKCSELDEIIAKPIGTLTPFEAVFLATWVVYRYRNNIFHGNKGVESWLRYEPQIKLCTGIMQVFVGHVENRKPRTSSQSVNTLN